MMRSVRAEEARLLYRHGSSHHGKMPGEGTNILIGTRLGWSSEFNSIRLSWTQ